MSITTPSSTPTTATDHEFNITISGCSRHQAEQVIAERISYDEDYGFDYSISYQDSALPAAVETIDAELTRVAATGSIAGLIDVCADLVTAYRTTHPTG